jgi:hypothetical protein
MKIDELQGADIVKNIAKKVDGKRADVQQDDAVIELSNLGWRQIGAGSFARVLKHPNYPYVLKLFDAKDTCYLKFLNWVSQNQNSPYLPEVRGKPLKITKDVYAIRLERLSPIRGNNPQFSLMNTWHNYKLYDVRDEEEFKKLFKMLADAELYQSQQDFIDFLFELSKFVKSISSCEVDYHDANVMQRNDILVVIDILFPY